MTRFAFILEALGFALLAAAVAAGFAANNGDLESGLHWWLALVTGSAGLPIWLMVHSARGRVHLGMAVLAGVLTVLAAYGLGALVAGVLVAWDAGVPLTAMVGGVAGFAMFGLLLTGIVTLPLGALFAVAYGAACRLWRSPG
ncbi:hypothetical protein [Zavarzinia compransoris]|uniref:Uncharacterized protein n=1 Tax=Zavarzinia compransoris TaxID=1264899 RepID=A0A317E6Z3_9PROT|nr:hypothetical protein [Zavarzinia compransoris]PWR20835.1 hypothetical protein DKG75_12650 [Zavarzinia compransoris]TDP44330.1 hypothetical protein DES42_10795 [Zavarzinia compransoris]